MGMANGGRVMKIKAMAILAACTALSGCAERYVELYVVPVPLPNATVQDRILASLTSLHLRGKGLKTSYETVSRNEDLAQLPLVGAAVAIALIAVNKPSNGADTMAKIGIGAGAYGALRSIAMPTNGPEAFRKGVDAINCVIAEGGSFVGQGIPENVQSLSDATVDLDSDAALLTAAMGTDVVIPNDAKKKEVELARANAKLALARAVVASQAARAQLGAWENAPVEFERAAATIFSTLAAKTSVRTVIDVSDLAASWTKAPKTDGAGGAQGLAPGNADALIALLTDSTNQLDAESAQVGAIAAGFQFVDHLKAVVKCPALV